MDNIQHIAQAIIIFKWHFAFVAVLLAGAIAYERFMASKPTAPKTGVVVAYTPMQAADEDSFFDQMAS